ncbi:RsmB/NOP family class I SAM-dependent RNA methyltransferase [Nocardioides pantholopis]|uniref:RsmB/NOP family class I SAM-dependent RNA methyltransferase n=1 Tax=Nocardioides pantholopis TaxID=2483798 RepID=UPI000FDA82A9|nr:transcription antitermination factor NusB [Nocardioides pantholopis]
MAEPARRRGGNRPRNAARTTAPGGRGRPVADPARAAALDVLKAVRVNDAYANLVLPAVLREHALAGRDAAFATELASGTLRRQGTYDAVLAACIDRSLAKVEAKVLDALRLGTHQLLGMRVPAHAAISTTVDLVRSRVGAGAAGFANAVLRRVSEHDLDAWVAQVAPDAGTDPVGHAAIAHSHPRWVVEQLRQAVGPEELDALLAADNAAPRVTLVARPGRATREELPGTPTPYSPYGVVLDGGDPGAVPAVAEGRAGVQDEGSQLVAEALAAAPVDGPDRLWLDLCAGPGGKAALLAALAAQRGARLLAIERQPHRARLVRRAVTGSDGAPGLLGVLAADGTAAPLPPGSVDRVLVDAPCTGLGALRRRPEARWRRRPDDLLELVLLQRALVTSALDLVRPGGVVLYATCSPVTAETSGVVTSVLEQRRDAVLEDAAGLLPQVPDAAGPTPGTLQLWPHRHGTDAMFMALLRKR